MIEYFIENASSFGDEIDDLFTLITVIVGFWFFLVQGVFFYFIFKFRRKEGVKAKYISGEEHYQVRWIHWPHYAVIACDIVIIVVTVNLWMDIKMELPPAQEKIRVIAQQWTWIFVHPGPDGKLDTSDDVATVNELHLKVNTVYHYDLQSKDVIHDFSIPVFRFKQDAIPGRTVTGWFEPIKTGEWDIQCAEICGIGHGLMAARVIVESEEDHKKWLASQRPINSEEVLVALAPKKDEFTNQLMKSFQ